MKIEGIDNIGNSYYIKPILQFILDDYEGIDVEIEEVDDHTFSINDQEYAIFSMDEQDDLIENFNVDYFEESVYEVPENWRKYIDKDKWIDDNGIVEFEDYWDQTNDSTIAYVARIEGYYIYKID